MNQTRSQKKLNSTLNDQALPLGVHRFSHFPSKAQSDAQWLMLRNEETADLRFTDYISVVKRRKWLIILVLILFLGMGLWLWRLSVPVYVSKATVQLNRSDRDITLKLSDPQLDRLWWRLAFQAKENYLTHAQLIQSRSAAKEVVKRLGLARRPELLNLFNLNTDSKVVGAGEESQNQFTIEEMLAEMVSGMISVEEAPGARLLRMRVVHQDPEFAQEVLSAYIKTHIDRETSKMKRMSLEAKKFLEIQHQEAEVAFLKSLEDLVNFTQKNGMVAMEGKANHLKAFFYSASQMLAETSLQQRRIQAGPGLNDGAGSFDHSAAAFARELGRLESRYSSQRAIYNDDHPSIILMRERLKALKQKLSQLRTNLKESASRNIQLQKRAQAKLFQNAKEATAQANKLMIRYEVLKRAVEKNEQLFRVLSVKLNRINMELESLASPIDVVDPPSLPIEPAKSLMGVKISILGFLGLFTGFGLACVMEFGNKKIKDAMQLRRNLGLRVLGVIPAAGEIKGPYISLKKNQDKLSHLTEAPRSPVSEAIRSVETMVSGLVLEKDHKSIVVTSLYPSEGRTFITASLASALSSRHGRVLVVDSDLRSSGMSRVFKLEPNVPGLSDILSGRIKDYRKLVRRSRVKGLFFLPAGTGSKNPGALLGSKPMRDLVATLSEDFDMVVFDSPPLQIFSDSTSILQYTHSLAMVVESNRSEPEEIDRSLKQIPGVREKLLGVILNKADFRSLKYGRYGYYNYKYYSKVA